MWNTYGWEPIPAERWVTTGHAGRADSFYQSGRKRLTEDERIGHSTSKIPPFWEPRFEQAGYPFRVWLQDVNLWSGGTELALELQAPAVAQRLGGTARDLVRQVPVAELRDGRLTQSPGSWRQDLLSCSAASRGGTVNMQWKPPRAA